MEAACQQCAFPAAVHVRGFFTFATPREVGALFATVGRFELLSEHSLSEFLDRGSESRCIRAREARNLVSAMFRKSWEQFCRDMGLHEHLYASQTAFHITDAQAAIGKRVAWGRPDERRSSMLCNIAAGKVWQYGVSAAPHFRPFPHFRLKARVLFAELAGKQRGAEFQDAEQQHRLRRSVCKGWRNKAWHGRLMAFLAVISSQQEQVALPLSESVSLTLEAKPVQVTAPVTTALPNDAPEESEERDESTLGNVDLEEAI